MVLRSPCVTPLANSAGSTLTHTPTPSSTLMGVAAQHSSRSLAMASRMSITGGLLKTLKRKSWIANKFLKFVLACVHVHLPPPLKKIKEGTDLARLVCLFVFLY